MSKNLISKIAHLLGVEIGEEFKILDNDTKYKFSNTCLAYYCDTDKYWKNTNGLTLYSLLQGNYKIVKQPWKPKLNETYYTYCGTRWAIAQDKWLNWAEDNIRYKHGFVFKTEQEAIEARPRLYKEYMYCDWSE